MATLPGVQVFHMDLAFTLIGIALFAVILGVPCTRELRKLFGVEEIGGGLSYGANANESSPPKANNWKQGNGHD
jgi:hypothetical protein